MDAADLIGAGKIGNGPGDAQPWRIGYNPKLRVVRYVRYRPIADIEQRLAFPKYDCYARVQREVGMPSSLGLAGDLDDVDMLEDVEAAFGFRVSDEDLTHCWTVGDLFEMIEARLPSETSGENCATAMCFYRLRRAFQSRLAISLRPNTPIGELRPLSVRDVHRIIKKECGLRPPPPILSLWGCVALVLTPALPLGAIALGSGWWVAAASAIVAGACYRLAPIRHPESVQTFGDLVRRVSSRSIGTLSKQGARLRSPEAWAAFTDVLSDHTTLPKDKIIPETSLLAPKRAAS